MAEELIEAVRSQKVLYDTTHPDYIKIKLKDDVWDRIADTLKFENGTAAKEAWLQLRNCHRDALRTQKEFKAKSGQRTAVIKRWKYEQQMEFLVVYMTNREISSHIVDDDEDNIQLTIKHGKETKDHEENCIQDTVGQSENTFLSNLNTDDDYVHTNEESSYHSREQKKEKIEDTRKKKSDVDTLFKQSLERREERFQEKALERKMLQKKLGKEDALHQFFMAMCATTATMPPASQHMVKKEVFRIVSNAEEALLFPSPGQCSHSSLSDSSRVNALLHSPDH